MKVTFQLTPEDYRQGLLAWRNLRPWRRWFVRAYIVFLILVFVVSIGQSLVARNFVSGLPGMVLSVTFLALIGINPSVSGRRQFRNTPSAQDPITIEASDPGLQIHSVHADSKVAWSTYVAWGENKSVFIILPQPKIFIPIPKHAFATEQLDEFREILRHNIGKE